MGRSTPCHANSWIPRPSLGMTEYWLACRSAAHDPRTRPLRTRARTGDGVGAGEPADGGGGAGHPAMDAAGEAGGAGAVRVRGVRVPGADAGVRFVRLLGRDRDAAFAQRAAADLPAQRDL